MPPMVITSPLAEIADQLRCPSHRAPLKREGPAWLFCPRGCSFHVLHGIPRFTTPDHYASAFGQQWNAYRQTQLDSYTGVPYSRQRLDRCVSGLDTLRGRTVLEVGSGAGRFTEILVDYARALVSLDPSRAVTANQANCQDKAPYLLMQADINASPLPERAFDVVVCLGVIQHTPSPEQTIENLAWHVRPGGWLVFDHYTMLPGGRLSEVLTLEYPLRAMLRRLARTRPRMTLQITRTLSKVSDPIRRRTVHHRWLDRFVGRVFVTACYYRSYPQLAPEIVRQWNELDTHDALTDWYKHRRSCSQVRATLRRLGFTEIACESGGNGIEVRACYPG